MKTAQEYFPVVLTLQCQGMYFVRKQSLGWDSNESYAAVYSCCSAYYVVHGSNFFNMSRNS